jgi:hypothetical protein
MNVTAAGRGFRRSIGLVLAVLFLDLTTGYESIPWQWPIVTWQMYQKKAREEPLVKWRRMVANASDGSATPTGDCGTLHVLEYPYRMDSILRQDMVGLLSTCLRELQGQNPAVTAVSFENRSWRYQQQSLVEHLSQSAAHVYRVVALRAPLPLGSTQLPDNLIRNGDFASLEPETGLARYWTNPSARQGIGVDLLAAKRGAEPAGAHAGLVPALRAKQPQVLEQELALPLTSSGTKLALSLLALATAEGASVELSVSQRGQASAPIVADASWHRVEVVLDCSARPTQLTGQLRFANAGSADAFVADVSLRESPAPLGMAN